MKSEEWRISCVPLVASGRAERLPRRRTSRSIHAHSWFIYAHSCYAVGNFVCDATRMCMNEARIIMNAAQRIIHAHSCFIYAHSCYAVGKYIYVCDATRMCMNGSRIIMNAAQRIIHAHSWFIYAHSCVPLVASGKAERVLRRRQFCLRRYTNVHALGSAACYRRDARMKHE